MEVHVSEGSFQEEVINSEMPVFVDFWAPWCMPCLMVAPILEELAKEYEGKIKVCKLNVDEVPSIASQYGIMAIPTMMIFKNGEVVEKIVGALPKSELEEVIKKVI
jgi:thioredoxin 1